MQAFSERMLKRALFLCLGLWLIAASALSAHASPCGMRDAVEAAPVVEAHAHCDMMAAPADDSQPAQPEAPDDGSNCCCPAVLASISAPAALTAEPDFGLPEGLPANARAPSRTLIPEPPPPKA